jgi:hypothetical protein
MDSPNTDDYLGDYERFTDSMQFRVGGTSDCGKALFATEDVAAATELLEEMPLVQWPVSSAALGHFCEACLHRDCEVSECACGCGFKFCSPECAHGTVHELLCRSGGLHELRRWQADVFVGSQYGAESVARCNARVAADVVHFSTLGLPAGAALQNALRPLERLCAFPPDCELALGGASVADLRGVLETHSLASLSRFLCAHLPPADGAAIARQLLSTDHVEGLLQRLLLNSLEVPTPPAQQLRVGGAATRFAGVFLLTACCNHSCEPNLKVACGSEGSLMLRTTRAVASGEELRISYVDVALGIRERQRRLQHWTISECGCARCTEERAGEEEDGHIGGEPAGGKQAAEGVGEAHRRQLDDGDDGVGARSAKVRKTR